MLPTNSPVISQQNFIRDYPSEEKVLVASRDDIYPRPISFDLSGLFHQLEQVDGINSEDLDELFIAPGANDPDSVGRPNSFPDSFQFISSEIQLVW